MAYSESRALYDRAAEKFTEFELKVVPQPQLEENGYERLFALTEDEVLWGEGTEENEVSTDTRSSDPSKWQVDEAEKLLVENHAVLKELHAIGGLDLRVRDWQREYDRWAEFDFSKVSRIKRGADLLLLEARVAAIRGDQERYRRAIGSVFGIAQHLSKVSEPYLLTETLAIMMRVVAYEALTEDLKLFGFDEAIRGRMMAWLRSADIMDRCRYAEILRGEAIVGKLCVYPHGASEDLGFGDRSVMERMWQGMMANQQVVIRWLRADGGNLGSEKERDSVDRKARAAGYAQVKDDEQELLDAYLWSVDDSYEWWSAASRSECERQARVAALMLCKGGELPTDPQAVIDEVVAEFGGMFDLRWDVAKRSVVKTFAAENMPDVVVAVPLRD
ncbi:hypothetical protein [Sulfuriroseicoccus oceanibius]|uniref:Uncharacterized protein n=1 Tax=Sulfuriroseicoccus oceanibius TaxID=2707525 RepID=A0A6B3LFY0_9BACT|nr:hypothetical protein [Sulfuriroseicoccus oceanibius]QQL44806.1 hypothetical protein G3M56_013135 [Sulfuriroseicoccus oceanibius]